jgi:hypothetical protein
MDVVTVLVRPFFGDQNNSTREMYLKGFGVMIPVVEEQSKSSANNSTSTYYSFPV